MVSELKYLSDRNLAYYYREELFRVHHGEKVSEVFTENTRRTLRLHGFTLGFGAGVRLTGYALKLLEEAGALTEYRCPVCGAVKNCKKKMDFHLKYGHPRFYEEASMNGLMQSDEEAEG